jgi:hypothetical protein
MIIAPAAFRATTVPGLHRPLTVEAVVIGVAVVLLFILLVWRTFQGRNLKRRKAASGSYFDADVAHYGTGPAGFSGAAAARLAGPTPLAPSFDSSGSGPTRTGRGFLGDIPVPKVDAPPAAFIPPTAAVGAGWLPDPSGDPAVIRYWDGTAWTEHTADRSR